MSPRGKRQRKNAGRKPGGSGVKSIPGAMQEALKKAGVNMDYVGDEERKVRVTFGKTAGRGKGSLAEKGEAVTGKRYSPGKSVKKHGKRRKNRPRVASPATEYSVVCGDDEILERRTVVRDGHTMVIIRRKKKVSSKSAKTGKKHAPSSGVNRPVTGDATKTDPCDGLLFDAGTKVNTQLFSGKRDNEYRQIKPRSVVGGKNLQDNVIELFVGMDFGTAFTKVIVQEPASGMSWAIPFTDSNDNPYLIPSRVCADGGSYTLHESGVCHGNLKVPLLLGEPRSGSLLNTVAFIGLVLRHVKNWTVIHKRDELAGLDPAWIVNLGLPARNLENRKLLNNFRILLVAGMLIAHRPDETVTERDVQKALVEAQKGIKTDMDNIHMDGFGDVRLDEAGIYPELSAQIFGYVSSDKWDHKEPKFMLVDVGGGTVDASIFNVTRNSGGDYRFSFFKSSVKQLGAYMLHLRRLEWMKECADKKGAETLVKDLDRLHESESIPDVIPGDVNSYLKGATFPDKTVDNEFYEEYWHMLYVDIIQVVKSKKDPTSRQWGNLPFLLTGGGREVKLYKEFQRKINSSNTNVRLRNIAMDRPDKLDAPGLSSDQYQRLSVAYGLSFPEIGKYVTPDKIADIVDTGSKSNWNDKLTTKEMT